MNTAPPPSASATSMLPPARSASLRQIARPRPCPGVGAFPVHRRGGGRLGGGGRLKVGEGAVDELLHARGGVVQAREERSGGLTIPEGELALHAFEQEPMGSQGLAQVVRHLGGEARGRRSGEGPPAHAPASWVMPSAVAA